MNIDSRWIRITYRQRYRQGNRSGCNENSCCDWCFFIWLKDVSWYCFMIIEPDAKSLFAPCHKIGDFNWILQRVWGGGKEREEERRRGTERKRTVKEGDRRQKTVRERGTARDGEIGERRQRTTRDGKGRRHTTKRGERRWEAKNGEGRRYTA